MGEFNPYAAPKADVVPPPFAPAPLDRGCGSLAGSGCLGCLVAFFLGGAYGLRLDSKFAEELERKGDVYDMLPSGTFGCAFLGSIIGAVAMPLFLTALRVWRARRWKRG